MFSCLNSLYRPDRSFPRILGFLSLTGLALASLSVVGGRVWSEPWLSFLYALVWKVGYYPQISFLLLELRDELVEGRLAFADNCLETVARKFSRSSLQTLPCGPADFLGLLLRLAECRLRERKPVQQLLWIRFGLSHRPGLCTQFGAVLPGPAERTVVRSCQNRPRAAWSGTQPKTLRKANFYIKEARYFMFFVVSIPFLLIFLHFGVLSCREIRNNSWQRRPSGACAVNRIE